jgi:hypothetical protein
MEKNRNFLPFIGVFVGTAIIASIIIWFVLNRNNPTTIQNPATTVTPTVAATVPTSAPVPTVAEISKKLKIEVLNGTDINGQAAVLKNVLTKLGFTSVAVGNSSSKSTVNTIQMKTTLSADANYFQQTLAGYFDAVPTTDLKTTSTYDVVFTIGTDLSQGTPPAADTTTPVETSTPTATPKVTVAPTATPTQ